MSFELETAIAAWRHSLRGNQIFLEDDLEELECHLRDHVDQLKASGLSSEEALERAMRRLGHYAELESEYRKVQWTRSKRKRRIGQSYLWEVYMLQNYFKTALRNLLRRKGFSLINVLGLAMALAAGLLILQYVSYEMSYDRFHEHADDLYRLTNDRYQNGALIQHGVLTYPSVPKALKAEYPEVINYARIVPSSRRYVRHEEVGFDGNAVMFADSAFLNMFSFPLLAGDTRTALAKPHSIILSETTAKRYFGPDWEQKNVLGQPMTVDNEVEMTVTGVFADVLPNSHMQFDALASFSTLAQIWGPQAEDSWTNSNFRVYLQLAPGTNPAMLESKLPAFSQRHFEGANVTGSIEEFFLQPLKDIHLYSDYEYEAWTHGSGTAVWAMLLIAGFILAIAWLNYISLSTARALERAKEVGVRKVVGAGRRQLMIQFLIEAALMNGLALGTALLMVLGLRPLLGRLLQVEISGALPIQTALSFAGLFVAGMLISGVYPALMLSSFRPVSVLKGSLIQVGRGRTIWKGLVVVQFALSFGLIAGTYTVYRQIQFMRDQDLGMNIDQMLALRGPRLTPWDSTYFANVETFKSALLTIPGVQRATASLREPGQRTGRIFDVQRSGMSSDAKYTTSEIGVDHDYFETFEMKILAGRSFDASDHHISFEAVHSIVINESAARLVGFNDPEDAVHERLRFWDKEWEVVGIVADHHQQSLKVSIEPTIFLPLYSTGNNFYLRVSPEGLSQTVTTIKEQYLTFFPGNTFDYFFLDDAFNEQYAADVRFRNLFGLFSGLGIVLASLGLFGLSLLTTARRTKEIGVRKVLGASVATILGLLVRDFVKLVVLATLIACPLAYVALSNWLAGYAYHIDLGWLLFAFPAVIVLAIAVATVSYQSVHAARTNPVEALRYE